MLSEFKRARPLPIIANSMNVIPKRFLLATVRTLLSWQRSLPRIHHRVHQPIPPSVSLGRNRVASDDRCYFGEFSYEYGGRFAYPMSRQKLEVSYTEEQGNFVCSGQLKRCVFHIDSSLYLVLSWFNCETCPKSLAVNCRCGARCVVVVVICSSCKLEHRRCCCCWRWKQQHPKWSLQVISTNGNPPSLAAPQSFPTPSEHRCPLWKLGSMQREKRMIQVKR